MRTLTIPHLHRGLLYLGAATLVVGAAYAWLHGDWPVDLAVAGVLAAAARGW